MKEINNLSTAHRTDAVAKRERERCASSRTEVQSFGWLNSVKASRDNLGVVWQCTLRTEGHTQGGEHIERDCLS